ncbi:MAG: hypothetical protein ACLQVF_25750 [Isosphaeraceae bacterium]
MEYRAAETRESNFPWSTERKFGAGVSDELRASLKPELEPVSSLPFEAIHDTLCIEHQDGTGDVYFVGDLVATDRDGYKQTYSTVVAPELGFVVAPRALDVAEIVRRLLAGSRLQPRWISG